MIKKTRKRLWSEGVYLLGRYEWFGTGCWLLEHNGEAAIVELPPYNPQFQESPASKAYHVCKKNKYRVKYILCTHTHIDHLNAGTARAMQEAFPDAEVHVQRGFEGVNHGFHQPYFFDHESNLDLGGEALHLVHAPKHSMTDTMIIFKGVIIAGDWELNTLKSSHDDKPRYRVPNDVKLRSIERMQRFQHEKNYRIHKLFSVHANDRRENIDFNALMEETKIDRNLW
jgi:hydroxyacylglutathione hydrolase